MKTITLKILLVYIVSVQCHTNLKQVLEDTHSAIAGISKFIGTGMNLKLNHQPQSNTDSQISEQTSQSGLLGLLSALHPSQPQEQIPEYQSQPGYGHRLHGHHRLHPLHGRPKGEIYGNQYGWQGNRPNYQYENHAQHPSQEYNSNGQYRPNYQLNDNKEQITSNPTQANKPYNYGQGNPYNPGQYGMQGNNYNRPNGNQQIFSDNQQANNMKQENQNLPVNENHGVKESGSTTGRPSTEFPKRDNVPLTGDQYVYGADGIKVKEPETDDDFAIDIRTATD